MISEQSKGGFKVFIHNKTYFAEVYQTLSLFSKIWKVIMKDYSRKYFSFFLTTAIIEKNNLKTGGTNNMMLTMQIRGDGDE